MVNFHSCVKIVLNLVFNDKDDILLIQEAKNHSRGLWFLPAGKVKEGESIVQAGVRETIEESGIEPEIISLLKIQHVINKVYVEVRPQFIDIFRFVFVSKPKFYFQYPKDNETKDSIQARWFQIDKILNEKEDLKLRSYEVVELLNLYLRNKGELMDIKKMYEEILY
jgi:8-oxo-dGDP phosphatase